MNTRGKQAGSLMAPVVFTLMAAILFCATPAVPQTQIEELHQPLADFDSRAGVVEPTSAQLSLVASLGAEASWNQFGTPQSLIKYGGYLATGVGGTDAVAVARNWISANRALFRLSAQGVANLELLRDSKLVGSNGHAVIFRQKFGVLPAVHDGIITVGVVGNNIGYVSSSLTADTVLTGQVAISAVQAWLNAAADVGRAVSPADIGPTKTDRGWTTFGVTDLGDVQRARLVAVPTPTSGVRPAYETLLIDKRGGGAAAFRHFVDAETGAVLVRTNILYQSHPTVDVFSGTMPQVTDGECASDNGPWVVSPGENVESIVVSVEATLTTNDVVLHLLQNGNIVATQDTLFSPEVIVYAPSGGVAPATYSVRVCDFVDNAVWDSPSTFSGQIAFNPAEAAVPYPPKWRVFEANPLLGATFGFPWNFPNTDTRKLWCWESVVQGVPEPDCDLEVQNLASRVPWDFNVRTGTPTFTSIGNNANAFESWHSPCDIAVTGICFPTPAQRPLAADRRYDFSWQNRWQTNRCDPLTSGLDTPGGNDILAATTNLFAMHNRMHDWWYFLGFTEENFNMQDSNFGNAGEERDPLLGGAQAAAVTGGFPTFGGRDNAFIVVVPDGVSPFTMMFVWQPLRGAFYSPCVDGDYDMSVIAHEFTHAVEVRTTGKGGGRSGHHGGAMGESWTDLAAMEYLNEYKFVPVSGENPFSVGAYATGNKQRGIRNYGMNSSPLNFSDMGYDAFAFPSVHANGEIWSATQFAIRQALINKYNASFPASDAALQKECADGKRPVNLCPGNRRWIQLVHDALLLVSTAPSMLNARDAMLAADVSRFAGANQVELWLNYARRGFGKGARSSNAAGDTTSSSNDSDPRPDFASLRHANATVRFRAVALDEGKAPINTARIYVGHYEARVSPIADTNPSTSAPTITGDPGAANNLDDTAEFAPGTYEFVAHAPGYGHVRFTRAFSAGSSQTITIEFPTNRASMSKGATASGDGANFANLIDDTERTSWQRTGATPDVNGTQVTVDLAGTSPVTVRQVNVSALLPAGAPGGHRFTALRKFRLETSTNGTTFTPVLISAHDALPGVAPRPAAPDMILRSFRLAGPVSATHVRLVVLTNQCTGQTQFQGEQDNDPLNVTDCRGPAPPGSLARRDQEVRIAELQVFSSVSGDAMPPPGGNGNGQTDDDDFDDDGERDDSDVDDDNDGTSDAADDDDDNDGTRDDDDADDDNDGIGDDFDSESTREVQTSLSSQVAGGGVVEHLMDADANTLLVTAAVTATSATPKLTQPLTVEIYDPLGILVGISAPTPGQAVASAPVASPGTYTVRVRNSSGAAVSYDAVLISRHNWL